MKATNLADNLRRLREAAGLTQDDVAQRLGLSRAASVSDHERGETVPRGTVLNGYAALYGVTVRDLMFDVSDAVQAYETPKLRERPAVIDGSGPVRQRMVPKVYERVYAYLASMEGAGVAPEAVEEAERLFTRDNYAKLHSGKRELTEDEQLQVVEATWRFIRDVIFATEGKRL